MSRGLPSSLRIAVYRDYIHVGWYLDLETGRRIDIPTGKTSGRTGRRAFACTMRKLQQRLIVIKNSTIAECMIGVCHVPLWEPSAALRPPQFSLPEALRKLRSQSRTAAA